MSAVKEWKCAMAAWRKCGPEGTGRHSLTVRLSTLAPYVGLDAVRELKVRRRGEVKSNTYIQSLTAGTAPTFIRGSFKSPSDIYCAPELPCWPSIFLRWKLGHRSLRIPTGNTPPVSLPIDSYLANCKLSSTRSHVPAEATTTN